MTINMMKRILLRKHFPVNFATLSRGEYQKYVVLYRLSIANMWIWYKLMIALVIEIKFNMHVDYVKI